MKELIKGTVCVLFAFALAIAIILFGSGCASPSRMGIRGVTACATAGRDKFDPDRELSAQRGTRLEGSICVEFGE